MLRGRSTHVVILAGYHLPSSLNLAIQASPAFSPTSSAFDSPRPYPPAGLAFSFGFEGPAVGPALDADAVAAAVEGPDWAAR